MATTEILSTIGDGAFLRLMPGNMLVVGSTTGGLSRYDLSAGVNSPPVDQLKVGGPVRGIALHPDGDRVLVAAAGRGLVQVTFTATTPEKKRLLKLLTNNGVAIDPIDRNAFITSTDGGGRVVRYDLDSLATSQIVTGVVDASTILLAPGLSQAIVLSQGNLMQVDLATGIITPITVAPAGSLGDVIDIAWVGGGDPRLLAADHNGRVVAVDPTDPSSATTPPQVVADGLDPVWGIELDGLGGVLIGSGTRVLQSDLPPARKVRIETSADPYYMTSWNRVPVKFYGGSSIDDVIFAVHPPEGGRVSHSTDVTFDPAQPHVVLSTGGLVGDYELVAYDSATGDKLDVAKFAVTDAWTGEDGPPLVTFGTTNGMPPDGTWGGGDPYVPQNVDVHPALGSRRVGVLIVETTDIAAMSATDAANLRTNLENEIFNGVVEGGVNESTREYFRQMSHNAFDMVNAGVAGPLRLPNQWTSYAATLDPNNGGTSDLGNFSRAAVARLRAENEQRAANGQGPLIDLTTVDSLIVVVRTVPANPTTMTPERFHWPYATRPGGFQLTFEIGTQTISVPLVFGSIDITIPLLRTIQTVAMPHDWATQSTRHMRETVAHELGHNLGLLDEYWVSGHSTDAQNREIGSSSDGNSWTLMKWEGEFPELAAVEKMLVGWVRPEWVLPMSFATVGPVDTDVVLHAAELGAPPVGRYSAVEIRKGDGTNYYFEYRREQSTLPSEQDLPSTMTVLGTEYLSGDTALTDRRRLLRVPDDSDNDDAEFQTGDDYEETDTTTPKYPNDFKMSVVETKPDWARINIKYSDAKPDPQIWPWAASTNWKSPDIDVQNARNLADSNFANMPWEGHANTIVAKVRNPGKIDAKQVRVEFFWKDFTLSNGTEHSLGTDIHDIPKGTEVLFTAPDVWVPYELSTLPIIGSLIKPHYCVVVRIAEYSDPSDPAIREVTPANNEAQSNYTSLISASASPSSREAGVVRARNPYSVPARVYVNVRQTSPLSRTYLDSEWVHLEAGEEREIPFYTESLIGEPTLEPYVEQYGKSYAYEVPNHINLTGIADNQSSCQGDVIGGSHVVVRAARATQFVRFEVDGGLAHGRVETVDTGEGVNGPVIVTIAPDDVVEKEESFTGQVHNGDFRMEIDAKYQQYEKWTITGHYLGQYDKAPCDSKPVTP